VENRARNRLIAIQAAKLAESGRSVLILVSQIAHGKLLQSLIPEAQFAHGGLDTETRRAYVSALERKLHPVLIATTLADEGLDIPSLDSVILAGGGKSATKAYQRIGRALRPSPGKDRALIFDYLDSPVYLDEHGEARLQLYRGEPEFEVSFIRTEE
jgi:superfamily II DNA or RNA helicase